MAEALDRAHRAGITHRDLKPGNIMLAKDGAKVLDFGLAKIGERGVGASAGAAGMQTITTPLTGQGAIVGTLQYMAPEQLEGKEADARSDIFAFGTVIYEMVTGRRAFEAKSEASLIAAILEHEPTPIAQLQPLSPRLLDRLVRDCLAKDPDQRRQTAHDVLLDLKWIASAGMESQENAATRRRDLKPWFAAALAVALAVVGAAVDADAAARHRENHAPAGHVACRRLLWRFVVVAPNAGACTRRVAPCLRRHT